MHRSKPPSLDRLRWFVAVAEAGGFTLAADRLATGKTQLSHHVARLERELGGALFTRTTRRVELTDAGRRLYDTIAPLLRDLDGALGGVDEAASQPSGTLRITAPTDYAASVVGPALAAFQRAHPRLVVELVASDDVLDLVGERIDLAVRFGWLRDSSMRAVRLGEFAQWVVGSPAYFAEAGTPRRPNQLAAHRWIALRLLRSPLTWRFAKAGGRSATVRVRATAQANSPQALLGLLRGGGGVSVITDFATESDVAAGTLQRVLADWQLPSGGIHLVYPATRQPPAKVRHFIDFFRDHVAR
ncbi:DNA-binding transcriptional LysR family regulator [Dokdonella fugitiva]|uniref:DNA-binding transcriptional LysR family regulator n=1 Tax=Dokdonella fugitiva TaxID=328517 RepID=A0A839F0N0_9GAMM|nr:LysR family transcriptional regulator [Dokdonella fugitiva]MBA8885874.1 DNA-binding transcriptional LysR family regulator [Dokdonella fugitiva]